MNEETKTRNSMIDIIKGLGMVIIILTHFNFSNDERLRFLFPFWVDPAVPIFIIISGYMYAMSYQRKNIVNLSDGINYKFIIDKIVRYTIPFAMAYVVEVTYWIIAKLDFSIYGIGAMAITGGIGPGSYYYPIMIQFIFIFPFIYCIIRKFDFCGVMICFFINGVYEIVQRCYGMSETNYRLLLFRYIFLMAFGCYLFIGKTRPKKWVAVMSVLLGAGWLVLVQYMNYKPKVITYWYGTCLFAALWIVPFMWILIKSPKLQSISCKPLELCGKASYNIFLTQMVFYMYGSAFVYRHVENRFVQFVVCMVINLSIGIIFYLIENKITKFVMNIIKDKDYFERQAKRLGSFVQRKFVD